jgi:hypothetical protein
MTKRDITWGAGRLRRGLPLGEILRTWCDVVKMTLAKRQPEQEFSGDVPDAIGALGGWTTAPATRPHSLKGTGRVFQRNNRTTLG